MSVLIVDDDNDMVETLEQLLREEGISVTTASNGEEALEILKSKTFCLILLDFRMPKMNGYHFANQLRRLPQHEKTALVLITSDERFKDNSNKPLMDIDRVIMKPLESKHIVSVIRDYCSRQP